MSELDKAFILAAGLGTRMRPLTDDRPKALVEVAGMALIDHLLAALKAQGVKTFVVNVHYFADRLEAHLKAWQAQNPQTEVLISDERDALLETGGGLKKARALLGEAPIWVANIDSLWIEPKAQAGQSLRRLKALWQEGRFKAALLLAQRDGAIGFEGLGDFFLDSDQALRFRNEAPWAPYAYMGVHITTASIINGIDAEAFSLSQPWRALAPSGALGGVVLDGQWMHVGDPKAREAAEALWLAQ